MNTTQNILARENDRCQELSEPIKLKAWKSCRSTHLSKMCQELNSELNIMWVVLGGSSHCSKSSFMGFLVLASSKQSILNKQLKC